MKKWSLFPCLLLSTVLAAQTSSPNSPSETDLPATTPPAASPQTTVPAVQMNGAVPAGTVVMVRLETTLATFSNRVGDPFHGSVTQPIVVNGQTIIPAGATVEGRVTKVSEPRRISGKPTIGILPETVILPTGERYYLDATLTDTNIPGTDVSREGQFKGEGHDRRDQLEVGGGATGGMLVGGLIGGPAGVLVGGAVGAGATTTHWLVQHRSAILPSGTQLTLELNRPMTMMPSPQPTTTAAANGGSK